MCSATRSSARWRPTSLASRDLFSCVRGSPEDGGQAAAPRAAPFFRRATTEFVLRLSGWLARRQWRGQESTAATARVFEPVAGFADGVIASRQKKVRKGGRDFATMGADRRHQLRIDVKKLRYATDLFGSLYRGTDAVGYLKRLGQVQDALGHANDVAVAVDLMRRLCASCKGDDGAQCRRAGAIVLGWHAHALDRVLGPLARRVRRFVEAHPPKIGN